MNPAAPLAVVPPAAPPPQPPPLPRSFFVTVLGWITIGVSAVIVPISFISFLMVLGGSPGTAKANFLEGLMMIGGPPATVFAGIGLLRRWRSSYLYLVIVLIGIFVANVAEIVRGPTPARSYTSAVGVPTTVLASEPNYTGATLAIAVSFGLLAKLVSRRTRAEFRLTRETLRRPPRAPRRPHAGIGAEAAPIPPALPSRESRRGPLAGAGGPWRVGREGRDGMFYEERLDGSWQRIELSGDMLMGRAHHVIYFASPTAWQAYPEWARGRRDEIVARVKSRFSPPDYEYDGDDPSPACPLPQTPPASSRSPIESAARLQSTSVARPQATAGESGAAAPFLRSNASTLNMRGRVEARATPRTRAVVAFVLVALLSVTAATTWLVVKGLRTGVTYLPSKHVSSQRSVSRDAEPALFWVSISLFTALGAGTGFLAARGVRDAIRPSPRAYR